MRKPLKAIRTSTLYSTLMSTAKYLAANERLKFRGGKERIHLQSERCELPNRRKIRDFAKA